MAKRTQNPSPDAAPKVQIKHFMGMQPNIDPHDLRPGVSVHQVNVMCGPPNELRVRLGCKQIQFDPM